MSRHSESRSKAKARREANAAARREETLRVQNAMWGRTNLPAKPDTQTTAGDVPAQPHSNPANMPENGSANEQLS